jgi:hypothetical protein
MFDVKTGGSGYINGEEPNTPIGIIEIFQWHSYVVKTRTRFVSFEEESQKEEIFMFVLENTRKPKASLSLSLLNARKTHDDAHLIRNRNTRRR